MPKLTASRNDVATAQTSDDAPSYPIGSVGNALNLLRLFGEQRSIRVAEASRHLGVARSTAHRLIQMLQYHGLVTQVPESKAYIAGPELIRMAISVVSGLDLRTVSRPIMQDIVDVLEETAHISVLQGSEILIVESIETAKPLRVGSRTGIRLPAHATAAGKALLAGLDPEKLDSLYRGTELDARTPRTLITHQDLERNLDLVRKQGYATSFGESEEEVSSVAVRVEDGLGHVRAALAISAPPSRLGPDDLPRIVSVLTEGAKKIRDALPV